MKEPRAANNYASEGTAQTTWPTGGLGRQRSVADHARGGLEGFFGQSPQRRLAQAIIDGRLAHQVRGRRAAAFELGKGRLDITTEADGLFELLEVGGVHGLSMAGPESVFQYFPMATSAGLMAPVWGGQAPKWGRDRTVNGPVADLHTQAHTVNMNKSLTTLAAVGAGYIGACLFLYARQRNILYRAPQKLLCADTPEIVLRAHGRDPAMTGWVDGPRESSHAIIYLGGSSESVELRRQDMGAATLESTRYFVPYRGFGPNKQLLTEEAALKHDALRLFEQAAARHDHVSVIARSLGTGIGIHLAAQAPVHRLGLITPYDSIAKVAHGRFPWIPTGVMLRDRFEAWRDAKDVRAPVAACLAGLDKVIPLPRWQELKRHFQQIPTEHWFRESDHTNIAVAPGLWQTLGDFVLDRVPELAPVRQAGPKLR